MTRLQFSQEQVAEYEILIKKHRRKISVHQDEMHRLKRSLSKHLGYTDDKTSDLIMNEMGRIQADIEREHFEHFKAIRKLCSPEQLDNFALLTKDFEKIYTSRRIRNAAK